jgi:hypothetical protein
MKMILILGLSALALASPAAAAEIHGTVSENDKPLPEGVALKLECGDVTASAKTDEFGSYSLRIAATGECKLFLDYKGSSPSVKVTLYDRPSRYDLVVRQEEGKILLGRK